MGKVSSKGKRPDRRKTKRGNKKLSAKTATQSAVEHCCSCDKVLESKARVLFVEEELGRIFCSEDCITQYFQHEIEALEKEYLKARPKDELTGEEREKHAHLRWMTLQEPDEIWRQKTAEGDHRYTLISEFKTDARTIWCVCICLFLRGEPSFLYIAFPTKSQSLVNHFRKGDRVEKVTDQIKSPKKGMIVEYENDEHKPSDGLAEPWTDSETMQAEIHSRRDAKDIPQEEFALYEHMLEPTLEHPDELWVMESKDDGEPTRYHFIKKFDSSENKIATESNHPVSYVVVAQESNEDSEQLEIVESIPTRDERMIRRFRRGTREETLQKAQGTAISRMVH